MGEQEEFSAFKLCAQMLDNFPPGIFAQGEIIDGPEGANMAGTGKIMRWVAVRGDVADWAIYCQNPHYIDSDDPETISMGYAGVWDWEKIAELGDKIGSENNVRKCLAADSSAMARYRF